MEEKNMKHLECTLSDTDIFTPAFVQTDIEHGTYEDVFPLSKLDDNGPIEFLMENATQKFLDLVNTYLSISCKVVKGDGTDLAATDKVTLINYPIASLFSQVDINLGGTVISSSANTYAYRAFLETLINHGKEAKGTQLTMGLYSKDTAGHMDETDPDKDNVGLQTRYAYTSESKVVELSGRIHSDIFNQGRVILNGLSVKIVFHRNKESFLFMADGATPHYKIKILNMVLSARKVQLTAHKFAEIQQRLEKVPASYPINRVVVKTHSLSAGLTSFNWDNAILGKLPNRIFIAMSDNESHTGSYKKNPFNFKHFDLSSIAVYVNGESLPAGPMKLNFASNQYLQAYRSIFTTSGKINRDEGFNINRGEYPKGYTLLGFDLSPALCHGGHQEVQSEGTLRISTEFSVALPNTITILLYCDFDSTISVNRARNILKDF